MAKRDASVRGDEVALHRAWPDSKVEGFKTFLARLEDRLPDIRMFLFTPLSEDCGAVETTSREYLANGFRLVDVNKDDVVATSDDGSCGLWMDYNWQWFKKVPAGVDELLPTAEDLEAARSIGVYEAEAHDLLVWGEWTKELVNARLHT